MNAKTVRADQVREGDWVRWPDDSDTMRRITDVRLDDELMRVDAYSLYDDFDYEWQSHQPVEVWRNG